MLPLLVLACLTGAPGDCETVTAGTWPDEATCQAAGRAYLPAAGVSKQAWTCGTDGFWLAEVAPGVYVHKGAQAEPGPGNGGDTANIGFVIGDDAIAVIDAGGSDAVAGALLAGIRARSDLPVRWLVLTHMHPDHVMGAGMIAGQGAGVVAHPALAAGLAARYAHYHAAYARDIGPGWQAAEVPPEIRAAPDEIDLGNRVLELRRHATGHTSNDLSVYDRRTGTWFLGDLVFLGHMPSIDGDLRGWQGAIAAAGERPADRVVPGHGPVAAPWPGAAGPTAAYLDALVAEVRAALDGGVALIDLLGAGPQATITAPDRQAGPGAGTGAGPDGDTGTGKEGAAEAGTHAGPEASVAGQFDPAEPGAWLLSDTFHPRNLTSAYRALEWE
ncbi:MBL fold metallo-hydrolase [Marinibacterium sp. SX1]